MFPHSCDHMLPSKCAGIGPSRAPRPGRIFRQLPAHVCVQRKIQRAHLCHSVRARRQMLGRHVVIRAPHSARVRKADFTRTLIRKFNESRIALAHGRANCMPAHPQVLQFFGIAAVRHGSSMAVMSRQSVWLGAVLAFAVIAFERGGDLRHLAAQLGILGRGRRE